MSTMATIEDLNNLDSFSRSLIRRHGCFYKCHTTGVLESGELGMADDWLREPTIEEASKNKGIFTEIVEVEIVKDFSKIAKLLD